MKIHYSLDQKPADSIRDLEPPKVLNISVRNLVLKTRKGSVLAKGDLVAEHPSPGGGACHAALGGKVKAVNYHSLTVQCSGGEETVDSGGRGLHGQGVGASSHPAGAGRGRGSN